jgi:hypothetical protein
MARPLATTVVGGALNRARSLGERGIRMEWRDMAPVILILGFVVLWFYILPRLGVRTT